MSLPSKLFPVCVLFSSVGCVLHNPDRAVLAALAPDSGNAWFAEEGGIQAEYLAFEDPITAAVFRRLQGQYRVAPAGTPLLCPSNRAEGMHGFNVRVRVVERRGSEAVAEVEHRCQRPHSGLSLGITYLVTRYSGKWRVVKPLVGSATTLSTPRVIVTPETQTALSPKRYLQRLLARIEVNSERRIRISSTATGRIQASAFHQRGDSVFLVNDRRTYGIAIADVDSLWAQKGTAALLLGSLTALPCAVFGMVVGQFIATDPDGNRSVPGGVGALVGGVVGAVPCGLLGAGVGSFVRRWQLKFARSAGPVADEQDPSL